jgi:hypothetical protein
VGRESCSLSWLTAKSNLMFRRSPEAQIVRSGERNTLEEFN